MNKRTIFIALVVIGLLAILFLAKVGEGVLKNSLPQRSVYSDQASALKGAEVYASAHGDLVISVLGTGSMAPYIPAAPSGKNPRETTVAYVTVSSKSTFSTMRKGGLYIYKADWSKPPGQPTMHVAAMQDSGGWIMGGLGNKHYEPYWRVTERNYVAEATSAHIWIQ